MASSLLAWTRKLIWRTDPEPRAIQVQAPTEAADCLVTLAFAAVESEKLDEALQLWQRVCETQPTWSVGYAGKAGTLRKQGHVERARKVLIESLARFPDDAVLTTELGALLLANHEHEAALKVWRDGFARHPDISAFHVGVATALRLLRKFNEADQVLTAALVRFPDTCDVWRNYAVTADVRGDAGEALRRWRSVMDKFPGEPIAYAGLGAALKVKGQFAEADRVFAQGVSIFPDDKNIALNHAWLAMASRDWSLAYARFSELCKRWPGDEAIRSGLSKAAASDIPVKWTELLMRFESLGMNCELGFVQRHFNAEPLDLFRWAGIGYDQLLQALDTNLDGIGAAENTEMTVSENGEFNSHDRRYGMSLHSFIFNTEASMEDVHARMCRRTTFLRNKLLSDLRDPSKIFVFNSGTPLSDDELTRLHLTLCRFGDATLLHIAPHPGMTPGEVAAVKHRLWRGSLSKTGLVDDVWDIDFNCWLTLCQTADRLNRHSLDS